MSCERLKNFASPIASSGLTYMSRPNASAFVPANADKTNGLMTM
jgi:hypothetical protein